MALNRSHEGCEVCIGRKEESYGTETWSFLHETTPVGEALRVPYMFVCRVSKDEGLGNKWN